MKGDLIGTHKIKIPLDRFSLLRSHYKAKIRSPFHFFGCYIQKLDRIVIHEYDAPIGIRDNHRRRKLFQNAYRLEMVLNSFISIKTQNDGTDSTHKNSPKTN